MNKAQATRDPSGRVLEGHDTLTMSARGQFRAPRVSLWAPVVAKIALAIFAAVVLAFIGDEGGGPLGPPSRRNSGGASRDHFGASIFAARSAYGRIRRRRGSLARRVDRDAGDESAPGVLPDGRVVLNVATETS